MPGIVERKTNQQEVVVCMPRGEAVLYRDTIKNHPIGPKLFLKESQRLVGNLITAGELSSDKAVIFKFSVLPPETMVEGRLVQRVVIADNGEERITHVWFWDGVDRSDLLGSN